MYKVICFFTDMQDGNHPYNIGDVYPRKGVIVSEDRLIQLSSEHNRRYKPLIALVDDEELHEKNVEVKEEPKAKKKGRKKNDAE